jgi:hypothetical protein
MPADIKPRAVAASHPLLGWLEAAANGTYPPVDRGMSGLPAPAGGPERSTAFTGHPVIATAKPADAVQARSPTGSGRRGRRAFSAGSPEHTAGSALSTSPFVACGRGGDTLPERADAADHPRDTPPAVKCFRWSTTAGDVD